ncbi:MAG: hypothetical protein MZU95_12855 [Desulfomicrobium escambiense]|nr:hypothetical protein [Desulfomicrobium escambiense]
MIPGLRRRAQDQPAERSGKLRYKIDMELNPQARAHGPHGPGGPVRPLHGGRGPAGRPAGRDRQAAPLHPPGTSPASSSISASCASTRSASCADPGRIYVDVLQAKLNPILQGQSDRDQGGLHEPDPDLPEDALDGPPGRRTSISRGSNPTAIFHLLDPFRLVVDIYLAARRRPRSGRRPRPRRPPPRPARPSRP